MASLIGLRTLYRRVVSRVPVNRYFAQLSVPSLARASVILSSNVATHKASWKFWLGSVSSTRLVSSTVVKRGSVTEVKTPPFAESITEGDVQWQKVVGDVVKEDEQIAEIETDKTTMPVSSPVAGVIEEILIPDGEKVTAGTVLCRINVDAMQSTSEQKLTNTKSETEEPPSTSTSSSVQSEAVTVDSGLTSPAPIPQEPPPVPPLPVTSMTKAPSAPSPLKAASFPPESVAVRRTETRVKMPRMRQRIAQRLKEAQNVNAMLTTFNEVDMSRLITTRKMHKEAFLKKHGVKLGFMSAFVKAASFALTDQPVVNAVIDGMEIVYRNYIDISVAVATPKGLVVPVVRNVDQMNYAEIEKEIAALGQKARDGTLAVEEMDGGTFTISNGGVFGSLMGTPIINLPQSAILGMHATKDRPVAIDGKVEIRPMMYVALTYDHRLIDGREAVLFLNKIKSAVEDPMVLLLDM